MPHTFDMTLLNDNIDAGLLHLMVEGSMWIEPDSGDAYEVWSVIAPDANYNVVEIQDVRHVNYTGNFEIDQLSGIRLTMSGAYVGGIPAGAVSQNYTVDISAPMITSVIPTPLEENANAVLGINVPITFQIEFVEQGNTAILAEDVFMRLSKTNGELLSDTTLVSIAANGRSGNARISVPALATGDYKLYAEVSDMAGNRTTATYSYRVGTDEPIVGG